MTELKMNQLRGQEECKVYRSHADLALEGRKNQFFDDTLLMNDIIKGYFKGDWGKSEVHELIEEGMEDDFLTKETGRLRKLQLEECIMRYLNSESLKPTRIDLPPKNIYVYVDEGGFLS